MIPLGSRTLGLAYWIPRAYSSTACLNIAPTVALCACAKRVNLTKTSSGNRMVVGTVPPVSSPLRGRPILRAIIPRGPTRTNRGLLTTSGMSRTDSADGFSSRTFLITSPFSWSGNPSADDSDKIFFSPLAINNVKKPSCRTTDQNHVGWPISIAERLIERVIKSFGGIIEGNVMFPQVADRLFRIPFELHP